MQQCIFPTSAHGENKALQPPFSVSMLLLFAAFFYSTKSPHFETEEPQQLRIVEELFQAQEYSVQQTRLQNAPSALFLFQLSKIRLKRKPAKALKNKATCSAKGTKGSNNALRAKALRLWDTGLCIPAMAARRALQLCPAVLWGTAALLTAAPAHPAPNPDSVLTAGKSKLSSQVSQCSHLESTTQTLHVLSSISKSKESRLGSGRETRITHTQIKMPGSFPERIAWNLSFCLALHSQYLLLQRTNICFLKAWCRDLYSPVLTPKWGK